MYVRFGSAPKTKVVVLFGICNIDVVACDVDGLGFILEFGSDANIVPILISFIF